MKKICSLIILTLLVQFSRAQFTPANRTLVDDIANSKSSKSNSHAKASGNQKQCGIDTVDYAYQKYVSSWVQNGYTSQIRAINISTGYRLGQFYPTPGDITVSGFTFYAWVNDTSGHVVDVYCELYKAGPDSLPTGAPVRADTLHIDTTFGSGALTSLEQHASWQPYKTDEPYILVVRSLDSVRVAVVANDYTKKDGFGENYACGSVGGRWYRCLSLNISGVTLDCDMFMDPYVKYELFNDFTFKDCYDHTDTVFFKNQSSPFYFSSVYNRYKLMDKFRNLNNERWSHRWNYATNSSSYYVVNGFNVYPPATNTDVRLISTLYTFSSTPNCLDTTIKRLTYQPGAVNFLGDDNVCSGVKAHVSASSTAETYWYRKVTDTTTFLIGPDYESKPLQKNDTLFVESKNKHCLTSRKRHIIQVTETPTLPVIKDDSVCLNSQANLVASTNAGTIYWYEDSTSLTPVHTGTVLQVGPLSQDTTFFVDAKNGKCTHQGRARVRALVSSQFAPSDPVVSNDTVICLLGGNIVLNASSSDTLRWYEVAAGGAPVQTGNTYTFAPAQKGKYAIYVDAYDGRCASSRLAVKVDVNHFPELTGLANQAECAGESILFDMTAIDGDIDWFDKSGTLMFTANSRLFSNISKDEEFYLEPYQGACRDTVRHLWKYEAIPFGKITESQLDTQVCDGLMPVLRIAADVGNVQWFDETGDTLLFTGNMLSTGPASGDFAVWYNIDNKGCATIKENHKVHWRVMPDANFDYQVTWRDVMFSSRWIDQGDYIWQFDDGTDTSMGTDVTHHYYEDKTYNVSLIVVSPFDCIDTITKQVTINTAGVSTPLGTLVSVFPNPTEGLLYVKTSENFKPVLFELVDLQGRVVYRKETDPGSGTIALNLSESDLTDGMYVLRCSNGWTSSLHRINLTQH